MTRAAGRARLLAPEVIQTSAMDCGPASLKCLLEGFGIPVSYGRLREACQTDVDGTSIDTIEEVAGTLGLDAQQTVLPLDHVLLPDAGALPALVVVRNPDGNTHFVVVWKRLGRLVQVMDPAVGRRWLHARALLRDLYVHSLPIPVDAWRGWATSDGFAAPLGARLRALGLTSGAARSLVDAARVQPSWRPVAALDAAVRMTAELVEAGGVRRGPEVQRVVEALAARVDAADAIPERYWTVRPSAPGDGGGPRVMLTGAVLIRVAGRQPAAPSTAPLPRELEAALRERPPQPARDLLSLLRTDGLFAPAVLLAALLLTAAGTFVEALLFRGLFDLGRELGLARQRLAAVGVLVSFVALLLLAERPIIAGVFQLGRRLEVRFRSMFLYKLPRLGDRYFQSRPISDMAERSHGVHRLRRLPVLGAQLARVAFELVLTTLGIVWLDPAAAPFALAACTLALAWPLLAQPVLSERELRVRTHTGALGRFHLDALLGLTAVRTHGAERAVRAEHEALLAEWAGAGLRLNRTAVGVEAGQLVLGFALAATLLHGHLGRGAGSGAALLMVYWALQIPALGQEAASLLRQYPLLRNTTLRLLEPLGAPEDAPSERAPAESSRTGDGGARRTRAMDVRLERVVVRAGGHTILDRVDLHVRAGEHLAIVGPSGAGKSSLVGLLLGWHRAAAGTLLVDGVPLTGAHLERLRRETAWVDPSVQLWNASVHDNLVYGAAPDGPMTAVLDAADLVDMLQTMPDGLQTRLGESGRRVSGGEGQRVRFGRALKQPDARLVLLDEPFRGLDRGRRTALLDRARAVWADATLLCVTHDIDDTRRFPRVLVVEGGSVVEDGAPEALLRRPSSRYRALLEREREVRDGLWTGSAWRRLRLSGGRIVSHPRPDPVPEEAKVRRNAALSGA